MEIDLYQVVFGHKLVWEMSLYWFDEMENGTASMSIPTLKDKINPTNLMFIVDNNNVNDDYKHWEYAPSGLFSDNAITNGFFMSQILQKIFWQIKNIMMIITTICDLIFGLITSDGNPTTGYHSND